MIRGGRLSALSLLSAWECMDTFNDKVCAPADPARASVPETAPGMPEGGGSAVARDRLLAVLMAIVVLGPVVAVLVTRTGRSYLPWGDLGLLDLRVRDVWSVYPPLVGPYSRYGWSHPGPMMFWLLAIPSGLARQAPWALQVGGAALQGAAIIWAAKLAWQRGGLALSALVLAGFSLVYATTGSWMVLEPWNPHVAVPFFGLCVLQAWLLTTGTVRVLPGFVVVATFVVQTHVGYLPLVFVLTTVVVGYVVIDWRRRSGPSRSAFRREWRRPVLWACVLGAALWFPVALETLLEPPGNVVAIAEYFVGSDGGEQPVGPRAGLELMAVEFDWPPPWIEDPAPIDPLHRPSRVETSVQMLVPVAGLAAAWLFARRRGDVPCCRAVVLASALFAVGTIALGRVTGTPWPYLFYWRSVVAVFVILTIGATFVRGFDLARSASIRGLGVGVAFCVVLLCAGSLTLSVVRDADETKPLQTITSDLVRQALAVGVPSEGVILRLDTGSLLTLQRGIHNEMERLHEPVFVDEELGYQFGRQRSASPDDVGAVWWVAETGRSLSHLTGLPDARLIARVSPLDASREAELTELQRSLASQLTAAGRTELLGFLDTPLFAYVVADIDGVDAQAAERVSVLNARVEELGGFRVGIVALPPDNAPVHVPF